MAQAAYETDFYGWTRDQATLLRNREFDKVDIDHLAEELNSMGARERRELVSRLRVLMMHLLKWEYQPAFRGASWERTIKIQRKEIIYHIEDNPSLKSSLEVAISRGYDLASDDAEGETGLPKKTFPQECPWTFEEMTDPEFWPGTSE